MIPALDVNVEDFEADVRTILAQRGDQAQPNATQPERPQASSLDSRTRSETGTENAHAIFDQMVHNMRYANTFNLGTIEIDRRFDAFEQALDQEEAAQSVTEVAPLSLPSELDDLDVLVDLVDIGESTSAVQDQPVQDDDSHSSPGSLVASGPAPTSDSDDEQESAPVTVSPQPAEPDQHPKGNPTSKERVDSDTGFTEASQPVAGDGEPGVQHSESSSHASDTSVDSVSNASEEA